MARELTITWEDPGALAERARAMVGLEFLRAIRDGELSTAPIQELLGFSLVEVDEGRVVFAAIPGEQHSGGSAPYGRYAAHPRNTGWVHSTLETKFNLVRPITADTGEIRARARWCIAAAGWPPRRGGSRARRMASCSRTAPPRA